jgi:hypothetical protein
MFWNDRSIADMESLHLSYGIGSICNAKLNKAAGTNNLTPAIFFVKKVAIYSGHRLDSKPTTGNTNYTPVRHVVMRSGQREGDIRNLLISDGRRGDYRIIAIYFDYKQ